MELSCKPVCKQSHILFSIWHFHFRKLVRQFARCSAAVGCPVWSSLWYYYPLCIITSFLFLAPDTLVSKFKRLSEADQAISPAKYTFVEDNTVFKTEGATLRLDNVIYYNSIHIFKIIGVSRGHDCMVVGFTTTCAISAYHH